ncbi:DUF4397 domain-containing protein [Mucilaginibacter sp.]
MINIKKHTANGLLVLIFTTVFLTPYISSCGKSGNASSVGLNVQFEVLNLSPNLNPVNLYLNFLKQNTVSYSYPLANGYFYLNTIDTPLQIKSSATTSATQNFFTIHNLNFQANHKYSLFITGVYNVDTALSTLVPIFTEDDSTAIPKVGYGKVRFVDASIQSTGIDVTANGTLAFSGIKFAQVSPYVLLPAGNYVFQMNATGTPTTILSTALGTTTIQDGRLYTLYAYGIPSRTDSAAFGAGIIINR